MPDPGEIVQVLEIVGAPGLSSEIDQLGIVFGRIVNPRGVDILHPKINDPLNWGFNDPLNWGFDREDILTYEQMSDEALTALAEYVLTHA